MIALIETHFLVDDGYVWIPPSVCDLGVLFYGRGEIMPWAMRT